MHKNLPEQIVSFSLDKPRIIVWSLAISTLLLTTLATLPSLWPQQFPALQSIKIDTDPENMLSETEPIRIFHNQAKQEFWFCRIKRDHRYIRVACWPLKR